MPLHPAPSDQFGLVPPPRRPLVRYFGVLSTASRWREHVVPKPDEAEPEQPQRSKPRGKTIDVADTLAGAGNSTAITLPVDVIRPLASKGSTSTADRR